MSHKKYLERMIWMICEQNTALGHLQSNYAEVGQCIGYSVLRIVV